MSLDNTSTKSGKLAYLSEKNSKNAKPSWKSSTSLKPKIGHDQPSHTTVPSKLRNNSDTKSGQPVVPVPWDDSLPSRAPRRPAVSGIREIPDPAHSTSTLTGRRGPPIKRETGFNRGSCSAVFCGGHHKGQEYDDEEEEAPTFNRQYFASMSKWRTQHNHPPSPKVPIITKIDVARKSKRVNILYKEPDRISRQSRAQSTQFLDLMSNIRYKIFNYIPTKERVKLQLVCRKFRDDIRVRIGIGMFCDENTTWGVSFMRDLMVDTIIVGHYRQPVLRPRDLILRWYDALHLIFSGSISIPYMDAFVNRCRGVQKISVSGHVCERQPIPIDLDKKRDYRSWRKVELVRKIPYALYYCKLLEIRPAARSPHLSVQCTLEVCHCVNIAKLKVVIDTPQLHDNTKTMYKAILRFMHDHPSLQEVWVQSKVIEFIKPSFTRKETLMPESELRSMSTKCQLKRLTVLEDNVLFYTWTCFLSEQRELEVLQVLHCMLGTAFYPAIETNVYTLTKIALNIILTVNYHDHDCANDRTKYFDLIIFKNCFVLKELYLRLSRPPRSTGAWDNHVGNFKRLPVSIEVLAFQNITFYNEDLMSVTRLKKLKSFGVIISSGAQLLTVNRELFGALFWMRSLLEFLLQGMQFEGGLREDMNQLKHYFYPMNYPGKKNTLYIRHKMDPKTCHWKMLGKKVKVMHYKFEDDNIIYEV